MPIRCTHSSHIKNRIDCFWGESEIKSLGNPQLLNDYYNAELKYFLQTNSNMIPCLLPNCSGFVEIDPSCSIEEFPSIQCPVCLKKSCRKCKTQWHEGSNCEKFQEWRQLNGKSENLMEEWVSKKGARRCPSCNMYVEKNGGCNHITCFGCKKHFCWVKFWVKFRTFFEVLSHFFFPICSSFRI